MSPPSAATAWASAVKHTRELHFVGPTGVGKTELVKLPRKRAFRLRRLAHPSGYVGVYGAPLRLESHRLPPGYVGYDEAGQLTEKIRRKPYSVILFDELEKAHPDVLNILLQILDDGRRSPIRRAAVVNFENTVIVMTSNAGCDRGGQSSASAAGDRAGRDKAMKALGEFLRPEFINRVDEIICFNRLDEENFVAIAAIMLDELNGQPEGERRGAPLG